MPYNDLQKGRYSHSNQIYFITTVLHMRKSLFHDFFCAKIVVYEMRVLHDEGILRSLAWVIMSEHIHWLFRLMRADLAQQIGEYSLRDTAWL